MNYYECAVICKNTELNLTLADQGILMGTGSFANNCQIAGCQVMGSSTNLIDTLPNYCGLSPIVLTVVLLGVALIITGIIGLWVWYKKRK